MGVLIGSIVLCSHCFSYDEPCAICWLLYACATPCRDLLAHLVKMVQMEIQEVSDHLEKMCVDA